MSSAMTSFLRVSLASSCWILALLSVFDGLGLAAIGKGEVAVLEELLEPVVELVGIDVELIAQVRDGDLVDEVPFENGDLLARRNDGVVGVGIDCCSCETSVQVMLTRAERFSRFD